MSTATEERPPDDGRAEHLAWAKERALEYVEMGDLEMAWSSLVSDLAKHETTARHPGVLTGTSLLAMGKLSTRAEMRRFIEAFA